MKEKLLALTVVSALAMGSTATLAATSYAPFDNASIGSGGNPGRAALLVSDGSNATSWGGVNLASTTVTTLSDLTFLGTDYRVVASDCGGGSPRFSIRVPAGNIFVYIGPPPSFTGCAPGWQSTGNLLSGTLTVDTSQIGGTFYDTWANALTLAGSSAVSSINLVVDGSWSQPAGAQIVLVDNVQVNGDTVTFEPDTTMVIPVVAQTTSYTSEITVRNPFSDMTLPISVFYTGGTTYTGSTPTSSGGRQECDPLNVPPLGSVQFSPAEQCHLSGNQFGYLTLTQASGTPSPFLAYSRTQTPGGNGFSVPAYPAAAIERPEFGHYVVALKRQAAAPVYQSNCFVASMGAATPYQIRLLDSAGGQIGNTILGSLEAYEMVRYLDIFAAAGLAAGDYSNVAVDFSNDPSKAALMGFCTVQENAFGGADFRMAQPAKTWRYDRD